MCSLLFCHLLIPILLLSDGSLQYQIHQISGQMNRNVAKLLRSINEGNDEKGVLITGLDKAEVEKFPELLEQAMAEKEERTHFPLKVIGQHGNFKFNLSFEEYKVGTGYFFERVELAEGIKLNGICYPDNTGAYSNYFDHNIPMRVVFNEAKDNRGRFRYRRC